MMRGKTQGIKFASRLAEFCRVFGTALLTVLSGFLVRLQQVKDSLTLQLTHQQSPVLG